MIFVDIAVGSFTLTDRQLNSADHLIEVYFCVSS